MPTKVDEDAAIEVPPNSSERQVNRLNGRPHGSWKRYQQEIPAELREVMAVTRNLLDAAVLDSLSPDDALALHDQIDMYCVAIEAARDLAALCEKDPATAGDCLFAAQTYSAFAATYHYRLAHAVYHGCLAWHEYERRLISGRISNRGKLMSGAEIHFRARIGPRFVLDHGFGTVIGETACLGHDCYLLGGITLGARGISSNTNGRRHPQIGNRVQIGAFANVLGCITVGDDVFLGPHCTVTENVPSGARILRRSEHQIQKLKA